MLISFIDTLRKFQKSALFLKLFVFAAVNFINYLPNMKLTPTPNRKTWSNKATDTVFIVFLAKNIFGNTASAFKCKDMYLTPKGPLNLIEKHCCLWKWNHTSTWVSLQNIWKMRNSESRYTFLWYFFIMIIFMYRKLVFVIVFARTLSVIAVKSSKYPSSKIKVSSCPLISWASVELQSSIASVMASVLASVSNWSYLLQHVCWP